MKNFNTNTENEQTWLTPRWLIEFLGEMDLDPCCPSVMPWRTAKEMIALPVDGLLAPWHGRVWLNPPYGCNVFSWLDRLRIHSNDGGSGLALIFARTETRGFHDVIWPHARNVYFFKGRLRFCTPDGIEAKAANAPSCLVSYSPKEDKVLQALARFNGGALVHINN